MTLKEYIFSLSRFILTAFGLFVLFILIGFFLGQSHFLEIELILEKITETLRPVLLLPPFGQFLFIFFNNSLTLFLAIVLGIIGGLFPFLVLMSNGLLLGIIAYFSQSAFSWSFFLVGIIPHGLVEIPVLLLACAAGLKVGKVAFDQVFRKQGEIKTELTMALVFFIKILLPLLILAAALEVFLTARLL